MAHYYHFKMTMCRERGDALAVGSLSHSQATRDVYEFEYEEDTEAAAADALPIFRDALLADLAKGPQHTRRVNLSATGPLGTAIDDCLGSGSDDASDAEEGPWSERVGKDVFRYSIGYSDTNAAGATTALTDKNLS